MRRCGLDILLFMAFLLTALMGCGKLSIEDVEETTVFVAKNGHITDAIVESFDKEYYNSAELEKMIKDELDRYASLSGDSDNAILADYEVKDSKVNAFIEFKTPEDYASFNDVNFWYGKLKDAKDKGYSLDVTLRNFSEGGTVSEDWLTENGDYHLVIISEPVQVMTYSKILCASANVDVIDSNLAKVSSESVGVAYIIIK